LSILRHIPNLFTLGNLFFGLLAIQFAYSNDLYSASLCILSGAFLDFFDGFFARLLKVSGELGKQLDSLADLITFGVAPSVIVFQLILSSESEPSTIAYTAFLIPLFSAYRLAKFNIDSNQSDTFIGLPTPANALFFISIPIATHFNSESILLEFLSQKIVLIVFVIGLCWLMVSNISFLALKFKTFNWKGNEYRFVLIGISIILLLLFHFVAVPIIILLYSVLSLINNPRI
jgi:CDP-diacylglycerol--serine O-phosphatidyltransferase